MKLTMNMLRSLNKACSGAEQWFEEFYIKTKNYTPDTEVDFDEVYNDLAQCFDNGFIEQHGINFEFGKAGSLKLLKGLKTLPEAILYYPDRVIYHDVYRVNSYLGSTTFNGLSLAIAEKDAIVTNYIDRETILSRYNVTKIEVTETGTDKIYKILNSCSSITDLDEKDTYILNDINGNRFELVGKTSVLEKVNYLYESEISEMRSIISIEQKIEDTVDNFTAWISV